jgi:hypothetical protein
VGGCKQRGYGGYSVTKDKIICEIREFLPKLTSMASSQHLFTQIRGYTTDKAPIIPRKEPPTVFRKSLIGFMFEKHPRLKMDMARG